MLLLACKGECCLLLFYKFVIVFVGYHLLLSFVSLKSLSFILSIDILSM